MNPRLIAITTLLIGIAVGITVGALAVGPLFVRYAASNLYCQPETLVLGIAHVYGPYFIVSIQNAGPGTVTLAGYGVSSPAGTYSGRAYPAYIYNGTTFYLPTANPVIGAGSTVGSVYGNIGPNWPSGAPTTMTIVTACNNKFTTNTSY